MTFGPFLLIPKASFEVNCPRPPQARPGLRVGDLLALVLIFVGLRQGFHWSRPVIDVKTGVETPHGKHKVFLPMNDDPAPPWVWNKANVQSVGGGFLVVDGDPKIDALRFYVGARTGTSQIIGNATVGFASLRR